MLGWRDVPVDNSDIGPTPKRCEPKIRQIFVGMGKHILQPASFSIAGFILVRQRDREHHRIQRSSAKRPEHVLHLRAERFADHL